MVFSEKYRISLAIQLKICIALLVATCILDILIVIFYIQREMLFASGNYWIKFCEYFTMIADGLLIFISIATVGVFISKNYRRYIMAYKMICMLLLVIAKEVCFFIFIDCYNYTSAHLIVARVIVQIILVAVLVIMVILGLVYYRQDYFIVNTEDESASKFENLRVLKIVFGIFFVATLIVVTLLNTLTLVNYKKVDNYGFGVDNIDLVYLDDFNYRQLLSGGLHDSSKISDRYITKLSALTRSPDVYTAYRTCSTRGSGKNKYIDCRSIKLRKKQINIECTNTTAKIFSDCKSAISLKLLFYHVEDGRYPRFHCSIRTTAQDCQPGCEQFSQGSKIVLIQKYQDKIVPAWQPKCNCYKPKIELALDDTINICNNPTGDSAYHELPKRLIIFFLLFLFYFNYFYH